MSIKEAKNFNEINHIQPLRSPQLDQNGAGHSLAMRAALTRVVAALGPVRGVEGAAGAHRVGRGLAGRGAWPRRGRRRRRGDIGVQRAPGTRRDTVLANMPKMAYLIEIQVRNLSEDSLFNRIEIRCL